MPSVWDTLGIAATGDIGAVRSAYARALKQIDMDADPRAYIALREARDRALQMIRRAAVLAGNDEVAVASQAPAGTDPPPEPAAAPVTLSAGPYEEHLADLTRLLAPDDGSEPVDVALVRARFEALLTDPRMEEIAFRAQAEAQLAHVIAASLPRSAVLIQPVMAAFGWTGPSRIDTPPAIAAILDAAESPTEAPAVVAQAEPVPSAGKGEENQARFFAEQYNTLTTLLFPQRDNAPPLTPDEQRTATGIFATLLCDPRMELVTFRVGAEAQFAQMIAYSIPRSDCIVPRAIAFFQWGDTQGRIDQPDTIARILHRERGLRFINAVQARDHPFHTAWNELRRPVSDKNPRVGPVHSGTIYNLLNSIRTEQPLLERELNPPRVALWDEKLIKFRPTQSGGGRVTKRRFPLWAIAILVFLAIGMLGQLAQLLDPSANRGGVTPPPVTLFGNGGSGTLSEVNNDLDFALARFGHAPTVTAADIRTKNPGLYAVLHKQWGDAHSEHVSRSAFADQTYLFLSAQFGRMLSRAPRDDLADYWRIEIARLEMQRRIMPEDCARYVAGEVRPLPLGGKDADAMESLAARVLIDAPYDEHAPSGPRRYTIPGPIVVRAAKMAGMPSDAFRAALDGKGKDGAPCTARIGLIKTVLDMRGKDGDRLLRAM